MNYIFHSNRLYSSISLSDFQYTYADLGWTYEKHRHPYYELLFCSSGEILQKVGSHTYHLFPGDTLIIQGGFFHETEIIADSEFLGFHFDIENHEVNRAIHSSHNILIREKDYPNISKIIVSIIQQFQLNLKHLELDNEFDVSIFELELNAYITLLLANVAKFNQEQEQNQNQRLNQNEIYLASEIVEIINTTTKSDLKVQTIADRLHLHRTYITNVFTKVYGMSPRDYILSVRLEKAKKLLLTTDLTMDDISERLDFSSASHFSTFFKKQTQITPSAFRKRNFSF